MLKIKIKYFVKEESFKLKKISIGDWIDLRIAETVTLKEGDTGLLKLGVAMELPEGYEAIIAPRSSTFKKYGIIAVNSIGVIDNSYKGDDDQWLFPFRAFKDVTIEKGTRIAQFRLQKTMPEVDFEEVEHLSSDNRGGIGRTGEK